jgi:two-component system OmpR family response regulator/two-component system copper resistance phosphate regulon response regulator CusR
MRPSLQISKEGLVGVESLFSRRPTGIIVVIREFCTLGEAMEQLQILIVEDDPVIGKALRKGFSETCEGCAWAKDGERGLELARSHRYDLIILDLMLPKLSGLDLLRQIRGEGIQTPVIVLTSLGAVEERVAGLQAGADDYLVKPFAFPELMARIDAVRRRSITRPAPTLTVGELTLNLATRRVTRAGSEIDLTPTEFSLLEYLMRHAGNVVTRKMLCEHLWESDWEGATNVIEVHINRLRGKIDKGLDTSLIQTVRGRGYALHVPE